MRITHHSTAVGRSQRSRRGGTMVLTVIALVVLIGFVGLAIDWGMVAWTAQKLQTAADSAALAGAQQVWWSHVDARNAAHDIAHHYEAGRKYLNLDLNLHNEDVNGDIVVGRYDVATKTFTIDDTHTTCNAVRVIARRKTGSLDGGLPLIFGPLFGKQTADIERFAIAIALGGPRGASVIALNGKDQKSFYISGNGYMDLGDGSAQVNSKSESGAVFQGSSLTFIASQVDMVGAWDEKGNPELNDVDLNPYEPAVTDPLASLPEPVPGPPMNPQDIKPTGSVLKTYNPGYYPKGLHLNEGNNVFLNPGVYILESGSKKPADPSFEINGHANLTGYGVMFFIRNGSVKHNGTGDVHLTPMTAAQSTQFTGRSDYAGIQFFQARANKQEANINGTAIFTGTASDVQHAAGSLYFPSATVKLNGNGDMYLDSIIADKIEVGGSGRKTVARGYTGRPPGEPVYLIE